MAMKDKDAKSRKNDGGGTVSEDNTRDSSGRFLPGNKAAVGRPKGKLNLATQELKELAQQYGPQAIETLQEMAFDSERDDNVRLKAIGMLLDRGYGKPKEFKDLDVTMNRHESMIEEIYEEIEEAFTGGHSMPSSEVD